MDDSLIFEKDRIENPEKEKKVSSDLKKKLKNNIDFIASNREMKTKNVFNALVHAGICNENLDDYIDEYSSNGEK